MLIFVYTLCNIGSIKPCFRGNILPPVICSKDQHLNESTLTQVASSQNMQRTGHGKCNF